MCSSLLSAFALGLLGSAHCVGMCGPLVLALPIQKMAKPQRILSVALYHTGRICIYSLGGLLFGWLGRRVYLAGWQQILSITLGVLILFGVVIRVLGGRGGLPAWARWAYAGLQTWIGRLWQSPSRIKFLLLGMGNGLLPCGMVYLAVAGALTSGVVWQAAAFMIFFGLGTLPMLLGLQWTGHMLSLTFRHRIRKTLPYLTACMAIVLILRGLNLGIPFISPILAAAPGHAIGCH